MKFLIIDNYDSFVYNIAQVLGRIGIESDVIRNDAITLKEIEDKKYDAIVISPGPGNPDNVRDFGVSGDVIRKLGPHTPILGVCLGHQGIISAFGGKVTNAGCVMHGKTSNVSHKGDGLFEGVSSPFVATRYHSLVGQATTIPDSLVITARADDDGEVMGVRHTKYPIEGVQFHPESIMTSKGQRILENFAKMAREYKQ